LPAFSRKVETTMEVFMVRHLLVAVDSLVRAARTRHGGRSRGSALGMLLLALAILGHVPGALADSTGEKSPAATSASATNGANACVCDGKPATFTGNNQQQIYSLYGLTLPGSALISGIQVHVKALNGDTAKNRKLKVDVSWNAGANYTAQLQTRNLRTFYRD